MRRGDIVCFLKIKIMTKELNGQQHAAIGALSGMTEVCIQQPAIYIKNIVQVQ